MTLEEYARRVDLLNKTEIEKVRFLAYYMLERRGIPNFTPKEVEGWFEELQLAQPNRSRLRKRLLSSKYFVKAARADSFALEARQLDTLRDSYPEVRGKSDEIIASDLVLPESLYRGTRGYIERLAEQVNASYEHSIFDGCAVLMRRLVEVLLILAYQHQGIDSLIQDSNGNYYSFERIAADAKTNKVLQLSRDTKEDLDVFRTLGNFSAHKIHYNARRADLDKHILRFRALVEELLYKAGLRT